MHRPQTRYRRPGIGCPREMVSHIEIIVVIGPVLSGRISVMENKWHYRAARRMLAN